VRNRLSVLMFSLAAVTHCELSSAASTFTVTATVAGLTPNSGLVLQDGTDVVPVSAAGTVTFPTPLPSGASYNVTVAQVPGNPVQYCTVTNGGGLINNADVTTPRVSCAVRYGRFAYTAGTCPASCSTPKDNTISIFGLTANGQWRQRGYQLTTGTATAVRVFPSQQWVYATTTPTQQPAPVQTGTLPFPQGGTLTAYQIDASTGRLTPINSAATEAGPLAIEFDPLGRFAFVANASAVNVPGDAVTELTSIDSFTIDARSGALTETATLSLPSSLGNPKKVVADPSGHFLYAIFSAAAGPASSIATFAINQSSAALTQVAVVAQPNGLLPVDLQFDPAGRSLYVVNSPDTVTTYRVTPATGVLTQVNAVSAGTPVGNTPASIAIDPASEFAYVLNSTLRAPQAGSFNEVSIFSIDPKSGALTPIGSPSIPSSFALDSLQVDPSGNFLEIASASAEVVNQGASSYEITTYPINRSSGELTGTTTSAGFLVPANTVETRGFQGEGVLANVAIARGSSPAAPVGKFAFVTNSGDANISTFAINSSSGAMTLQGTTSTGSQPDFIALDPLGLTAYVTSNATNVMTKFSVDPTSGALNLVGQFAGQTGPGALVVDPSGRFAYTGEGTDIQGFNGTTPLGVVGSTADSCQHGTLGLVCGTIAGLAIDPTGRFLFASNPDVSVIHEFSINANSGALTEIGFISTVENSFDPNQPFVLAAEPTGRFLYSLNSVDGGEATSYAISPTGTLTMSPDAPTAGPGPNSFGVAIDPSGRFAYVSSQFGQDMLRLFIDPTSGAISRVGPAGGFDGVSVPVARTLSVDPSGKFLYVPGEDVNTISTYRINPTSGAITLSGSTPSGSHPFSIATTGITP
jgi:6-phosphogluconolactonase